MASVHTLGHVEHTKEDEVGIWTITDLATYFQSEEDVEQSEAHFRQEASKDNINSVVIAMENADELGTEMRETLDYVNKEWTQLAEDVEIDRLAYVADGLMANTVKMKVEADIQIESFDSIDEAVEWCSRN